MQQKWENISDDDIKLTIEEQTDKTTTLQCTQDNNTENNNLQNER